MILPARQLTLFLYAWQLHFKLMSEEECYTDDGWESEDGLEIHPINISKRDDLVKPKVGSTRKKYPTSLIKQHALRHDGELSLSSNSIVALRASKYASKRAAMRIHEYNQRQKAQLQKEKLEYHARKTHKRSETLKLYKASNFNVKTFQERRAECCKKRAIADKKAELLRQKEWNSRWYKGMNRHPTTRRVKTTSDSDRKKQNSIKQRQQLLLSYAKSKIEKQVGAYVKGSFILKTSGKDITTKTTTVPWRPGPYYNQIEEMRMWNHPSRVFAK